MARSVTIKPRAKDPSQYQLHVVSFSVVREPGQPEQAMVSSPEAAIEVAKRVIADDAKEHFWILLLDALNRLRATHHVSTGTLSASLVHPREVFAPALRVMGVSSILLLHNHPSGDPTPSREDLRLTKQLVDCAKLLDLRIHDHVIIGSGTEKWTSLAQVGSL